MNMLVSNKSRIEMLCKKYNVRTMFAFGSVLTDKFNEESDIDILVSFDKSTIPDYFNNFFELKYELQDLFGREVDLVEEQTVQNKYLKKCIDESKIMIYGC